MIGNLNAVRINGYRALTRELGTAGAAVFLRQLENGSGDYTEERRAKMDENSVDVIAERIRKRNAQLDESHSAPQNIFAIRAEEGKPSIFSSDI